MTIPPAVESIATYFNGSTTYFFIICDLKGDCQFANPLFRNLCCHPDHELFGRPFASYLSHEEKDRFYYELDQCRELTDPLITTFRVISKEEINIDIQWEMKVIKTGKEASGVQLIGYLSHSNDERVVKSPAIKDEKNVRESELFYRTLIAESLDGVLLTDKTGNINFASPSLTRILGFEPSEVLDKNLFDFCHPDDVLTGRSAFEEEVQLVPRVKFISIRLLKKDGEWLWCIVRGHNMLHNSYVSKMVIYFADDTLRRNAEEALKQSELRFQKQARILHNVTDVIVTTDMDRLVTSWNSVTEKLTGIMSEEAVGKPFRSILETDYFPYTHEQVADIVFNEGVWRGELSFDGSGGEKKYLLHTISVFHNEEGESIGLLGVGKDITERKKVEAKLQDSEMFYRNMIAHSLDGIAISDKAGIITYCAPSCLRLSGYKTEELLSKSIFSFVHPDDIEKVKNAFIEETGKKFALNFVHVRLRHVSGNWIWCSVRGHSLLMKPSASAVVIYFSDDSVRKAMEDKVRESEEHFRNLIFNLQQGVILQDNTGKIIVCNQSVLEMLGVSEEQLLGNAPYDSQWHIETEDGEKYNSKTHIIPKVLETGAPVRDAIIKVHRPITKDSVWLLLNGEPVRDESGNIVNVICSFTDITEQKRLSQELVEQEVQKQKHVTQATIDGQEKERQQIGKELHDNINQHLTTTRLYLEVAREKANGEVLEMINHSHKTLVGIINEIRQLSQSLVPPTLGDLGLIESIQELADSLRRVHTFVIEFYYKYFNEDNLPDNMKLMLFRITQEQVNNIVKHSGAGIIRIKLQSDAENIILTITDDGKGFDPILSKRGMGFNNIINRSSLFNGKVEIESRPGAGCTLHVIIPL